MEPKTIVIFRRWRDTGDVLALFPEIPAGPGLCLSYQHVGQHGSADYALVLQRTDPALESTPGMLSLADELRKIGYVLNIKQRRPSPKSIPLCAQAMGCLCAGHARGNSASLPCDTRETA